MTQGVYTTHKLRVGILVNFLVDTVLFDEIKNVAPKLAKP
jgi:hypothetical protein